MSRSLFDLWASTHFICSRINFPVRYLQCLISSTKTIFCPMVLRSLKDIGSDTKLFKRVFLLIKWFSRYSFGVEYLAVNFSFSSCCVEFILQFCSTVTMSRSNDPCYFAHDALMQFLRFFIIFVVSNNACLICYLCSCTKLMQLSPTSIVHYSNVMGIPTAFGLANRVNTWASIS